MYQALRENKDIESDSQLIETEKSRVMVRDTDNGKRIQEYIADLETLLRQGFHTENIRIKQAV